MRRRNSYVAVHGGEVAGFSDVSDEGYIDMMFVSSWYSRRGVATALLTALAARARGSEVESLSADVSITARPFFERHGFVVITEQHPNGRGPDDQLPHDEVARRKRAVQPRAVLDGESAPDPARVRRLLA